MHYTISKHDTYSLGTVTHHDANVVMAHISVDLHKRNTKTEQALQHLYPDMLLSGAGKYTREAFLHEINALGASITTSVANGILTITLRSTAVVLPKLLRLLEVMLTAPKFDQTELKRVKVKTTNELHHQQENSRAMADEQLQNALYGSTDRRHTASVKTLIAEIKTIKPAQLKTLHETAHNTPWSCTVAGNKASLAAFAKLIKKLRKNATITHTTGSHAQKTPKVDLRLTNIPSRSNIDFSIGVPVPITLHHPDYTALMFALGVLAIPGFGGRLMNTVRAEEGLTYMIYGYMESFSGEEQGYACVKTFFTPVQAKQGLTSTYREFKKLYEKGITAAEFNTFQTIFETKLKLLQDSLLKKLRELHTYNQHGFTVPEIIAHKAKLKKLTRKQVNEAIKEYLHPAKFVVSGAGPVQTVKKELQRVLQSVQ